MKTVSLEWTPELSKRKATSGLQANGGWAAVVVVIMRVDELGRLLVVVGADVVVGAELHRTSEISIAIAAETLKSGEWKIKSRPEES